MSLPARLCARNCSCSSRGIGAIVFEGAILYEVGVQAAVAGVADVLEENAHRSVLMLRMPALFRIAVSFVHVLVPFLRGDGWRTRVRRGRDGPADHAVFPLAFDAYVGWGSGSVCPQVGKCPVAIPVADADEALQLDVAF